jgi:CheY-like chemotaxis protein
VNVQSGSEPSLLIVDDDPGAIQILRGMLADYPNLRFATSGADALDRVREARPDLILLDEDMPGMSGLALCQTLKADAALAEIPIIFVTAHASVEVEARALDLGAVDFLSKPVSPVQVRARVRAHLRLRQLSESRRWINERLEMALRAGDMGAWDWNAASDRMNWHGTMASIRTEPVETIRCLADHLSGIEPEDREAVSAAIRRCAETREAASCDYRARSDGDLHQIRSRMSPLFGDGSRFIGVVGVDQDFTSWHRARTQLLSANRQLEQFAFFASHDLRAPARQMSSLAALALERVGTGRNEAVAPLLERMRASGERIQDLVTSMLDLARHRLAEPGEWRHAAMDEVVRGVLADLAQLIDERAVEVSLEPMPEAYIPINLVAHVWRNLLTNAICHQVADRRRVWIGAGTFGGLPCYYVEDAGRERTKLEQRVARNARGFLTPEIEPTGMGIEICTKVLRVLGGQLWCEAGNHGGTRMRFSLGEMPAGSLESDPRER